MEGHTLVTVDGGSLLCFGGKRGNRYSNELWMLDPHIGGDRVSWRLLTTAGQGAPSPSPRGYHTATIWRGRFMIIVGGVGDDSDPAGLFESEFWIYDTEAGWRSHIAHGDAPFRRCHHSATLNHEGDSLYVFGGFAVGTEAQELMQVMPGTTSPKHPDFFDVHQLILGGPTPMWRRIQSANVPPMLWGHAAMLYAHNLIMVGGVDVVDGTETRTVCVWHTDRHEWRWVDFSKAPQPRALHSASVDPSSRYMYAVGGFGEMNTTKYSDAWKFSADSGKWSAVPTTGPPIAPRSGHASCLHVDTKRLYVHGGTDSKGAGLSDLHFLNLSTGAWTLLAPVQASSHTGGLSAAASAPASVGQRGGSPQSLPRSKQRAVGTETRGVALQLDGIRPDQARQIISHFMSLPQETLTVATAERHDRPGWIVVHVSTTNAHAMEQEMLRRCNHPDDPMRARLGVVSADWGPAEPHQQQQQQQRRSHTPTRNGLPLQVTTYPLELQQVIPYTDERRLVQSYHYPAEQEGHPQEAVVADVGWMGAPGPAAPAPKVAVSQTVQTEASGGAGGRVGGEARPVAEEEIIRKQRAEIESLSRRLGEAERAGRAQPPTVTGYLSIAEETVGAAPGLSASTPRGPAITLTKTTLADMLPYVKNTPSAAFPVTPQLSEAAAAHVTRSSAAAAVERRASDALAARHPSTLPTANLDHPLTPRDPRAVRAEGGGGGAGWAEQGLRQPAKPQRLAPSVTGKSPSLQSILKGNATMLSITHLGAGRPNAP